jgi:acyl-CoA reductase-like NAD-dependent aldehyde dehydrogenase
MAKRLVRSTEGEAIELENDTRSGLVSYFYTWDMGHAFRVSAALENGIVNRVLEALRVNNIESGPCGRVRMNPAFITGS